MTELLRVIVDLEEARRTVLARKPWDEVQVTPELRQRIEHTFGEPLTPDQVVARILSDVRQHGDRALYDYSRRIEGVEIGDLRVSAEEMQAAWDTTPRALRDALQLAADRIRAFHERQARQSWLEWDEQGGALGQIIRPLERVGLYAPGGRTPYPSSLLMAAIPARVAGVPEIVVTSPPGPDGRLAAPNLVAARVAGIDAVYKVGGAQAIAALAYGTETVPRVDKIGGPGNLFVVLAKRRVFGQVAIDGLPGPTETMLIADEGADAALVAGDLLAQAEHDVLASPLCLTPSRDLAQRVQLEIARQVETLDRAHTIVQSLQAQGAIVLTRDLSEAVELANAYAPEHLCLLVRDPWTWVGRVRNAGGVFVGERASEALGDYVVGPSHIMPTGGTARFSSPANVWDYLKITSIFAPAESTAQRIGPAAMTIARAEGLTAHAAAIAMRQSSHQASPE
ncbi:MAG: histidinol dehydrogenase [Anaerolineae bacterium]|nr:histidinol dehydrogenase [Anaerolineae bacterium]